MTSGEEGREQRNEPPARSPAEDEASNRSTLSDSIVGLFARFREAAETHDGE